MLVDIYNPSFREAEAGESLSWRLYYILGSCLKTKGSLVFAAREKLTMAWAP